MRAERRGRAAVLGAGIMGASTALQLAEAGGRFARVVTALWRGRPAVDGTSGLPQAAPVTPRHHVSLFVRAPGVEECGAVPGVGPFGDMKAHGGGRHHVS